MNHRMMSSVDFLDRGNGNLLAYRQIQVECESTKNKDSQPTTTTTASRLNDHNQHNGTRRGFMFLPGFMSNMNGEKALTLEHFCKKSRYEFIRFDYQGCGESKGEIDLNNYPFDIWKNDALAVLDNLTTGPQVLVGSSMGGVIMLLLALERPERIHSLIGISTPNFENTSSTTDTRNPETAKNRNSVFDMATFIGKHNRELFSQSSLAINCPIRLIHGMEDDVVNYHSALELARKIQSVDVQVTLVKSGTHRMSTPQGLEILLNTVKEILGLKSYL
ncbi:palmitoyl-protein thioesterase ABHD10, mitochondrial-like [Antedon mediterranea]|uniref:palmitoyl-protein thioesterase ABHD10, mitochondrial-like n=1 Tax=Antedon mediterranea TaxID=105859 RepID=UPI003AF95C0B